MPEGKPLVVDADAALLPTGLALECFWSALGRAPLATMGAVLRNLGRPARLKAILFRLASLRADLLPSRPDVAARIEQARAAGRPVTLVSACDARMATALRDAMGLDAEVMASDGATHLRGAARRRALDAAFGRDGYDYIGPPRRDDGPGPAQSAGWQWRDLLRALRPHQWVKNVLLLLPLIAAHDFGWSLLGPVLLGMVAFSAAASSIYIVNDLLDLEADRLHPTKRHRPFAAGAVPIAVGMIAAALLALGALGLALAIGPALLGVLALYMGLSLSYSLRLKRMRWVDIATLAGLYTIRVLAGAVAAGVPATGYLIAFIYPIFITLGCVKRLTELTLATSDERLPGRGYGRPDRGDLLNVAGLGTFGALLVFFLYGFSETGTELYPRRWLLWLALVPVAAWLIRMVWLGWTGKQDYDPIVFALRDRYGLALIFFTLTLMFYAAGLVWPDWMRP